MIAWYDEPRPWTCDRCGVEFDLADWPGMAEWIGTVQIDPYGQPLCKPCFGRKRLLDVLFAMSDVEVEPVEPGMRLVVGKSGRMWRVDRDNVARPD